MADLNKEDCTIGMSPDGEVCVITIPLSKYTLDEANGIALIYGKMRELQAHVMALSREIKIKHEQTKGLIKPKPIVLAN